MKLYKSIPLPALALLMVAAGCGEKKFKVEGTLEGVSDTKIALEKSDGAGSWLLIDSLEVGSSGKFSASEAAPGAPDIYRLAYQDKYIYFPVDSIETITITSRGKEFGRNHTLTGSAGAAAMSRFDSLVNLLPAGADAARLDEFKRQVYSEILAPAQGNVVSYYTLTKTIDGRPLYDINNSNDTKYFAAVATAFEQFKPGDPRTKLLSEIARKAISNSRAAKGKKTVVEAPELVNFEIERPGVDGNKVSLRSMLGKGKPVVLIFTALTAEESPKYNAEVRKVFDSGRADIFMVSVDADRYAWREAARNLPWTNVYDDQGDRSQALIDYNVTTVPTAFIFNSAGELIDRVSDPTKIAAAIR